MFTIIETLYSKTGEIVAQGKYKAVSRELAELRADELRTINLRFGGREGHTFTVTVKAA